MISRLAAFAALGLASSLHAEPTLTGAVGPTLAQSSGTSGRAVVVTDAGDVVAVGLENLTPACANNGVLVTRFDASLNRKWDVVFNGPACGSLQPRSIVANGEDVLVCGQSPAAPIGGFIALVHSDGGSPAFIQMETATQIAGGFYDMAIDPTDGTLWAVGTGNVAPYGAFIIHYKIASSGLTEISRTNFSLNGNDTRAYGVAATSDAVYVCGSSYRPAPPGTAAWLMKTGKTPAASGWSWLDTVSNSTLWSVAARGGHVFSVYAVGAFPPWTGALAQHDDGDGHLLETPQTYFTSPGGAIGNLNARVRLHPNLPLMAFGGGGSTGDVFKVFDFSGSLQLKADVASLSSNPIIDVDGVAFSNGLNYSVYAVSTEGSFMEVDGRTFFDTSRGTAKRLLIAPNVLALSDAQSFVRLSVVNVTGFKAVRFVIYDAAGRFVADKRVTLRGNGEGEWLWDGSIPGGDQRVRPGGFLVRVEDENGGLIERNSFLVVAKRGK